MAADPHDLFRASYRDSHLYPKNIIGFDKFGPSLETHAAGFRNDADRLWDPDSADLSLLELHAGDSDYDDPSFKDSHKLRDHLEKNRKDPRCRFAFIKADNSRAPLDCAADMFGLLATYHQVSPGFVNNVTSFGEQELPVDFNSMTFQHEDNLYARDTELISLPHLGRSGREIRHFFNIRAVEASKSEPDWGWSMRNIAVYHAFDTETGRSLWIILKANTQIKDRIDKAVRQAKFSAKSLETVEGSFASTLEALWIVFDWSDENWRAYINALDEALRDIVIRAKTAQIDRYAKMPEDLVKALKKRVTEKSAGSLTKRNVFAESIRACIKAISSAIPKRGANKSPPQNGGTLNPVKALKTSEPDEDSGPEDEQRVLDNLTVLKTFTFEELQRLHLIGERVNEALLVIGLTSQVLRSILTYYQDTFKSDTLLKKIRDECKPEMVHFQQRIINIERNLAMRQRQLKSMAQLVQDAKALFDGILQHRNMQISLLFAQSGYDSSRKMEDIAYKTEQETTSMHVITFVTLLFLPGTFLATFFQSGIIQLNTPDKIEGDWMLLPGAWGLFARVSFPLMLIVFIAWGVTYTYLSRRAKRRMQDRSNMV